LTSNPRGWDPEKYLQFESERTLPCRDLVARIRLPEPSDIADLGCGPGNSTAVLSERWPRANILGVDSSDEMLRKARASGVKAKWLLSDLREWRPEGRFDLVFSNATLHWIPRQHVEIPRLMTFVSEGGALAFQIPTRAGAWRTAMRDVLRLPEFRKSVSKGTTYNHSRGPGYYFDMLAPLSKKVEIWETEYVHVMPGPEAIVEWTRGAGLRPVLDQLHEGARAHFLDRYGRQIAKEYRRTASGEVLFPFDRLFVVAYR
jgi:trans-aconitate 2-methyltransferase